MRSPEHTPPLGATTTPPNFEKPITATGIQSQSMEGRDVFDEVAGLEGPAAIATFAVSHQSSQVQTIPRTRGIYFR